jgi:hypothetical protein
MEEVGGASEAEEEDGGGGGGGVDDGEMKDVMDPKDGGKMSDVWHIWWRGGRNTTCWHHFIGGENSR